jgi:nucleoside-specific outer membrane channel protein Tsx
MKQILLVITLCYGIFAAAPSRAQNIFDWQTTNIQLLRGNGFESDVAPNQTIFTFEHSHGWALGDNYLTFDAVVGHPDLINAEFSPRLSLSKMTGVDLSYGPVADVLFSATWEKARRYDAYLWGGAVDWNLPGFSLAQLNFYVRDNPDVSGTGWQVTPVWSIPFTAGGTSWSFDGYFDWADGEDGAENFHTQPQILMDIGPLTGLAETGHAYAGIEARYWHNAYAVEGLNEFAPQIMIKWIF